MKLIPILFIVLSVAGFILSGRSEKKSAGIWDIIFIAAFWNFFDTGWWFAFDWNNHTEPDMLSPEYMISAVPFILVILSYIKKRAIDTGPLFQLPFIIIPKPPVKWSEYKFLLLFFAIAVIIVIPVAYVMEFITWSPDLRFSKMPLRLAEYVIFVGFTEELVFRGILQNLFVQSFRFRSGRAAAILLANLFFAFMWTHAAVPQLVNWDYITLAFILGLFYAGVYTASGNLWAAAILHGSCDFLWITFFSR